MTNVGSPILSFIVLLMMNGPAVAQSCPALQVRNPAGNYIVPGVKGDIPYSGDLALDAYVQQPADPVAPKLSSRPRAKAEPGAPKLSSEPAAPKLSSRARAKAGPTIVVIHGGGWSSGSRVAHVGQILEVVTHAGYNWFSVDYRLSNLRRFEDSLTDLRAALAFIRCRAAEFGIDPNQLVLLGEDSGAQLAALLAAERTPGVIGAVLIGGFYDLGAIPELSRDIDPDLVARASPITRAAPQMPPLLVVHGGADTESPVEHARRYCTQIVQSGGRCQLLEVAGASHRSENWFPSQWTYKRAMVEWLSSARSCASVAHRTRGGVF